jgi:CRISPR system Cascade subunit CasC
MPTRIEFHILQSFAPSNLNRDDTGSPKDAVFGGARRGRISSQCLKRAARLFMRDGGLVPPSAASHRTKRVTDLLANKLVKRGVGSEHAVLAATAALAEIGSQKKMKVKEGKTEYLMFLGENELEEMAGVLTPHASTFASSKPKANGELGKELTEILKRRGAGAVDVALFGRMLANLPEANVDASCQVAHALSTHRVDREFDYYTAVDDLKPDDNSGADMIGTIEFNSSCYYRYSVVDMHQLVENLGGDLDLAKAAVESYGRAVIEAEPTGKQNTFAAHNPPSTVLAILRRSQGPRNLANAFEAPVTANGNGLIKASASRLAAMWLQMDEAYGAADNAWVLDLSGAFDAAVNVERLRSVDALVKAVRAAIV